MEGSAKNDSGPRGGRDALNRLEMHKLNSAVLVVIAVMFLAAMIITEDEPTAVGLLLFVLSAAWHVVTRVRIRRHRRSTA